MDQTILLVYFAAYMVLSIALRQVLSKFISLRAERGEPIISFLAKTICPGSISFSVLICVAFLVSLSGVHGFDDQLPAMAAYLGLLGAGCLLYLSKR